MLGGPNIRRTGPKRAKLLRDRKAIERRHHAPPRCHFPGGCERAAVEHHETVNRSQYAAGAADVDVMVPLCREHHDWVTDHPAGARELKLTRSRWELDQDRGSGNPDEAIKVSRMARPKVLQSEPVTTKLLPEVDEWLRGVAASRGQSVAETLRDLVTASYKLAKDSQPTGRPRGPVPKRSGRATGRG